MNNYPVFRRGVSGKLSPRQKIAFALRLLKQRRYFIAQYGKVPSNLTYSSIAETVGVYSTNTISRWDHLDMTPSAVLSRMTKKIPPRKFSKEEESILSGWVVYKDLTLESSTTDNFKEFTTTYFGRSVNSSYISKFMKRNKLSLKQVGKAHYTELYSETIEKAVNFLETIERFRRDYGIESSQIKVFDKTFLMTSPWHKHIRHLAPTGRNKPRKITCDRGEANELWTTLCANGVKGPFYVQTTSNKPEIHNAFDYEKDYAYVNYVQIERNPKTKKKVRPGEKGMLHYLNFMINEAQFFNQGDIILSDGEKCFDTPLVQQYLLQYNITHFVIEPSVLHQLISPCDNNLHSILKLGYYRRLSKGNHQNFSVVQKLRLAKECWDEISNETVANLFHKCGLSSSAPDKRSVVMNLILEGMSALGKNNQLHRKNLLSYLQWCDDNSLNHLASSMTPEILEYSGLLK